MTYLQPFVLIFIVITAVGLARMRHCKGVLLPALGLAGLFLMLWPPVDWLLSRPLEIWYRQPFVPTEQADAIVVLAGSVDPPRHGRPYSLADKATTDRCRYAAWLHTHSHPVPVLACGGWAPAGQQPYSATMRQMLQQEGVSSSMIWTEERSRSTYENAAEGAAILRQHGIRRILLITGATDMLRAERCFRKQGLDVVPAPAAYRRFDPSLPEFLPSWKAAAQNEHTLHETLGLAWYWVRGWI